LQRKSCRPKANNAAPDDDEIIVWRSAHGIIRSDMLCVMTRFGCRQMPCPTR